MTKARSRRNAEKASCEEILDALDLDPLGEWAMLHLTESAPYDFAVWQASFLVGDEHGEDKGGPA